MHYVTCRSHKMQKYKFGLMCCGELFMDTAPGPPKDEIQCVDVSCSGRTRIHYVTRSSYRTQKHNFSITCPDAPFMKPHRAHPTMKNSTSMIHASDALNCST
jgi:hypothetical protein